MSDELIQKHITSLMTHQLENAIFLGFWCAQIVGGGMIGILWRQQVVQILAQMRFRSGKASEHNTEQGNESKRHCNE